jgi:hypothetical protein
MAGSHKATTTKTTHVPLGDSKRTTTFLLLPLLVTFYAWGGSRWREIIKCSLLPRQDIGMVCSIEAAAAAQSMIVWEQPLQCISSTIQTGYFFLDLCSWVLGPPLENDDGKIKRNYSKKEN